jgi:hypothetical protein
MYRFLRMPSKPRLWGEGARQKMESEGFTLIVILVAVAQLTGIFSSKLFHHVNESM